MLGKSNSVIRRDDPACLQGSYLCEKSETHRASPCPADNRMRRILLQGTQREKKKPAHYNYRNYLQFHSGARPRLVVTSFMLRDSMKGWESDASTGFTQDYWSWSWATASAKKVFLGFCDTGWNCLLSPTGRPRGPWAPTWLHGIKWGSLWVWLLNDQIVTAAFDIKR